MTENFKFAKLSAHHKKLYVLHQSALMIVLGGLAYLGVRITNPELVTVGEKMSITVGALVGGFVLILAYANRLKGLLKVKFIAFGLTWVLLSSLQSIMPTLIMTTGLVLVPMMIDDLILVPIWRNVWYNQYER